MEGAHDKDWSSGAAYEGLAQRSISLGDIFDRERKTPVKLVRRTNENAPHAIFPFSCSDFPSRELCKVGNWKAAKHFNVD